MALMRDIIYKRGPALTKFIKWEKDVVSLRPVKKLTIKFDPFTENSYEIRNFSNLLHSQDVLQTNLKCVIKSEILTDRSEPSLTFDLVNGQKFIFECGNLKTLEIFQLINKHITPLDPREVKTAPVKEIKKKSKKK